MINKMITEAKVSLDGEQFNLKVDVNEDPTKKGIKVQFIPIQFNSLSPQKRDDLAMKLFDKLNSGLEQYNMKVERDRELKDKTIIGFFIYIEYLDKIIRNGISSSKSEWSNTFWD